MLPPTKPDTRQTWIGTTRLTASPLARYLLAVVVTLIALGVTIAFRSITRDIPFVLMLAAVTISSAVGGSGAGLLSTVLAVALADIFILPPYGGLSTAPENIIVLLIFSGVALLVNSLYSAYARAESDAYFRQESMQVTLLSIGDAVITTDTDGKITFLNPTAEALTGWSLAEAIGKSVMTVLNIINSETRQPAEDPIAKVMAHKLTVGLANHTVLIARGGIEYTIEDSAAPIRDRAGNITGVVIVFHDATAKREAEDARELLIAIADGLINVGTSPIDLAGFARMFTQRFADWCELVVLDDAGQPQSVRIHRDSTQQAALDDLYAHLPDAWNTADQAMQRGESIVLLTLTDVWKTADGISADDLKRLETLNPGSQVYIVLQVNGHRIGVLGLTRTAALYHHFTQNDIVTAEDIGRRISLTLDSGRLTRQLVSARQTAERNAERLAQLQHVTQALNAAREPDEMAQTVIEQVVGTFPGVYGSLIAVVDEPTRMIEMLYQVGYRPEIQAVLRDVSVDDPDHAEADVIRRNAALFFENYTQWHTQYPNAGSWSDTKSLALLPLPISNRSIGYMAVSFNVPQAFSEADRALLRALADQTAQALYRTQLYAAEQRSRRAIDTIMDGMNDVFFSLDRDMRYVYVNRRAERSLGISRERLIGRRTVDVLPVGDALQLFLDQAAKVLAENKPMRFEEYAPRTKEWFDVHLYPQPDGVTVFMADITARRAAEAQALVNLEQLNRLVSSDVLGIIVAGNDGRLQQANNYFLNMLGYTRADMEAGAVDWIKLTAPGYEEADKLAVENGLRTGTSPSYEKEYFHKNGYRVPVLIGGIYTNGTWVTFVIDLTEQKRAERGLRLLTEASAILTSLDNVNAALDSVAELAVESLADWCTIFIKQRDGTVKLAALASHNPAQRERGRQLAAHQLAHPEPSASYQRVLNSGRPELWSDLSQEPMASVIKRMAPANDEHLEATARQIGSGTSSVTAPLLNDGQPVGVIQFAMTESRVHYTYADLVLVEELARRISTALENELLYSEVQHERERLQVTLSSIGDAVIATDAFGTITFINAVAVSLTGWVAEDAIGRSLSEIFVLVNEYNRQTVESPVTKVLREGVIVGLANHTLLIARDGSEIPIDDSGAPIRDVSGKLVGVVLVFRDIRERRENERRIDEALQRTSDLYFVSQRIGIAQTPQSILAALLTSRYVQQARQVAIVLFDTLWDGTTPHTYQITASLNDSPLIGFAPDREATEDYPLSLFSAEQPIFIPDVEQQAINPMLADDLRKAGIASVMMFPLRTADGCFGALLLYSAAPNRWNDSDFQNLRVSADQIAIVLESLRLFEAEREAREEAERANQLKLQFLAMISHELRTPLTSIKGFISTLLATDVTWDAETQVEFLQIMDGESDKLGELISQLLDLSQLQAGTMRINPTIQPLVTIFEIANVQLIALAQNHNLDLNISDNLPPVRIDAPRVAEVLTNLVGNATKYTPPNTTIHITTERITDPQRGEMVEVSVRDEGPGIPPESREQIFEAFRQLERKGSAPIKGAGLGLAICKGIVEAHGGQIWVTDGSPVGAMFHFTLPTSRATP